MDFRFFSGKSLKFSSRTSFNDPLDSRPAYQISNSTKLGKQYIQDALKKTNRTPAERVLASQRIRNQGKRINLVENAFISGLLDDVGILCLSSSWMSMLMWSHYAEQHKGICVGFKSGMDVFQTALHVDYVADFPIIRRPEDDNKTMFEKTFFMKAECWKYENEWRILKRKLTPREAEIEARFLAFTDPDLAATKLMSDHNGPGIYQFNPSAIESVTLGMSITEPDQALVIAALEKQKLQVPVFKITRPKVQFTLSRVLLS
jgi:hypothetical protein